MNLKRNMLLVYFANEYIYSKELWSDVIIETNKIE